MSSMNKLKNLVFLVVVIFSGCEKYRYLDFDAKSKELGPYTISAVIESNYTSAPVDFNGLKVHESYPLTVRFFLESGLEMKPVSFEILNAEIVGVSSKKALELTYDVTNRVNRPTSVSHNKESLTMHFVAYEISPEELPFEDYSLTCIARIKEEDGKILESELQFDFKSSILVGYR